MKSYGWNPSPIGLTIKGRDIKSVHAYKKNHVRAQRGVSQRFDSSDLTC